LAKSFSMSRKKELLGFGFGWSGLLVFFNYWIWKWNGMWNGSRIKKVNLKTRKVKDLLENISVRDNRKYSRISVPIERASIFSFTSIVLQTSSPSFGGSPATYKHWILCLYCRKLRKTLPGSREYKEDDSLLPELHLGPLSSSSKHFLQDESKVERLLHQIIHSRLTALPFSLLSSSNSKNNSLSFPVVDPQPT
jgi:hypothetical protein